MNPTPAAHQPKPPGFRFYMAGFSAMTAAVIGVGGSGAFFLPKAIEEAASKAARSAAAEVMISARQDITVLQAQMSETNRTLSKIEVGVTSALDYMAEQDRMERVVSRMVKAEALKK